MEINVIKMNTMSYTDIIIFSDGYTLDEIQFQWRNETPVQLKEVLELPQFKLTGSEIRNCSVSYITGQYSHAGSLI